MSTRSAAVVALLVMGIPLLIFTVWRACRPDQQVTYHLEVVGGIAETLQEQHVRRLLPDTLLALTLRPETTVGRRMGVCAYLVRDSAVAVWPVSFEQSSTGVLRLQGTAQDLLLLLPGRYTIHLLVGGRCMPCFLLAILYGVRLQAWPLLGQWLSTEVLVQRPT